MNDTEEKKKEVNNVLKNFEECFLLRHDNVHISSDGAGRDVVRAFYLLVELVSSGMKETSTREVVWSSE